jgi:hypothetical protein
MNHGVHVGQSSRDVDWTREVADHGVRAIDRHCRRPAQQNADAEPEARKLANKMLSDKPRCSRQRDKRFVHGLTRRVG